MSEKVHTGSQDANCLLIEIALLIGDVSKISKQDRDYIAEKLRRWADVVDPNVERGEQDER